MHSASFGRELLCAEAQPTFLLKRSQLLGHKGEQKSQIKCRFRGGADINSTIHSGSKSREPKPLGHIKTVRTIVFRANF